MWEDFLDEREPTICPKSVYHTGYTGTFIVVDPEQRLAVILLTNRV
nr:serine hydrolase [Paludibacteraceae bacterium]